MQTEILPLWIKMAYTVFAAVTIAIYAVKYPLANFFWFSDIAMVMTVPALWLEHSLLSSTLLVGILLPEVFWNFGYFGRLLTGKRLAGLTDYMFDPHKPRYLRALSLFHVFLPLLLLWMVSKLGYAPRAFVAQTIVAWFVLPVTYRFADPALNVNWVRGFGGSGRVRQSPLRHLCVLMIGFPLFVYLPAHLLLTMIFN